MKPEELADGIWLYEGDCRNVISNLKADALITDPPYGVLVPGDFTKRIRDDRGGPHGLVRGEYQTYLDTYENFCGQIVPAINEALSVVSRAAVFTGPHIHEQKKPDAIGGVYCPSATGRHRWGFKRFLPVLFYGTYPNLAGGCKVPNTIMSSAVAEKNGHPCPKPLDWMKWLCLIASLPGETVLDCFAGSGTTAVAAMMTGRKCILVESDPKYCQIIRDRVRKVDGREAGTLFTDHVAGLFDAADET